MKNSRIALAALLCVTPLVAQGDYTAIVSPASLLATNFQGWGSSLCWWANVAGGYSNRNEYANLAFTQLKLNIVRYNIGGGENPGLTNTITNYRAIMQGFEPAQGVWDWNADQNQRWMLRTAISLGATEVDAFANSPPWWMTVSGSVTGAAGGSNNLQVAYENTFAIYLATVVSNLTKLDGVRFNFVTPVNEPTDAWTYNSGKQEGCHMTGAQQSRVVADLSGELNVSAVSAGIDAPEDYSEQNSIDDFGAYSGGALGSVALVTTHTYSADNATGLQSMAAAMRRSLWVSEYGDGDTTGLTMGRRIHDDVAGLGARAWVYWQVVDNASGWGFLYNPLTTNSSGGFTTNYTINEKFYVMGQFSEFIRPGCNIISVNDTNTLAAYNPANATLTLVAVNTSGTNLNVTYNLAAFSSAPSNAAVYQTSSNERLAALASLRITNHQFTASVPSASVTTFVLTNVTAIEPPDALAASVLACGPIAFWRLNEAHGDATACDSAAGFNGSYGAAVTNGQPGVPNPPFIGVPPGNLGVWMDNTGGASGFVTTPSLNFSLTNATLVCWVYPNGNQNGSAGLVFSRGSTANGINYGALNEMCYTWNNAAATYDWTSGLVIPTNIWSFLALVTTPSHAVAYVFNSKGQASATNAVANPVVALTAGFALGADPQSSTLSTRIFNGEMNGAAVFDYALSSAQLSQIYSIATSGLTMAVGHSGGSLVLVWPLGTVYQAQSLNGPWTAVPGAASPWTNSPSSSQEFYRIEASP